MPTPALPTTFSLPLEASKTCLVTLVALLTMSASQAEILAQPQQAGLGTDVIGH